ncbi:MAG TPA: response regulator, partial [Alkalispirochaeta sp.]|nr:response regulator [Alkalispirochaeta sp.]
FPGVREIGLLEALQRVARTGHPEQLPLSKYEDDSITGWRENRVFRLSSGEIVAVYDDLTGIKQAQHESELARKDAEQASRAKSEFLANMSHEIRTPMNAVIGLSQLLMQTPLNDRQQDHANKIYHSSQMLLGIINDILDFSKIESGKLELEERPFSLDEIVDQMATLFAETAYARALELLFDIQPGLPHSLVGDSLRISQVLTNLLSNATKFTDPGGMIQLGIREEGPATDGSISVAFSVRDTGIGMSEEDVARLFQPFTQGDSSTTRRHGGTGLGLVISRRLVETMGGTLSVDSEPGAGSTFTFTVALPIDAAEEHPDGCPMIQGERILLVDDQEAARRVMRDLLMHCGAFAIEEAGNGEDAIDQVLAAEQRGEPFDFILMDWMMPDGMNGAETSQTLKQMRQTGELAQTGPPILMVSAYQKDEISLPEGLVADFLSKPVTASSVYNALMRVESGNGGVHRQTPERAPIPDLNGQTILVVEDNAINREVAGLLIQKTGARVQTAEHGGEALELVREAPPNLILMDLQMPIMDGFEATRTLREEGYTVPIVALSAAVMDDDRQEAEEAGVDAHIGKPIESARLYATLAEYLATGAEAEETEELTTASADGESVLPAAVPGFDLTQGLRNLGGDDKLYARQLQQFQRKIGHDYAPLLDHLRTGDTEAARRVAHTLKGLAGTLAAVELRRLAQQIDETLAHGHTVERTVIDELEQALHAAEEALSTVARSHADAHSEPTERSGSAEAIDTLKRTLERYELVDQTVLEEALAYLRSRGHACDTLETYVEQMEFDSALQILDEILTTDHGSPA